MKDDDLNELPPWDDHEFDDEEGEAWKPNPTKAACKAMYQQWSTVMFVLKGAFDSLHEPSEEALMSKERMEGHVAMIMGDAYEVAVKIKAQKPGFILYAWKMPLSSERMRSS